MDKTTNVDEAEEATCLGASSHSQTSIQSVDSAATIIECIMETSAESTILAESSQSTDNCSITSNSCDGSEDASDESCTAEAVPFVGLQECTETIIISSTESSQSSDVSSSQESSEIATETSQECEAESSEECQAASQEAQVCNAPQEEAQFCAGPSEEPTAGPSQEPTAGPSREYQPVAGPSHEHEDPGDLSEDTLDEFPEIAQLNNLFELFESCPLTEKQKDMLYDKLVEGLKLNESQLTEMEATYERRKQFIKEFEAARHAAENTPPRDEHEISSADERPLTPEDAHANVNGIFDDDEDLPLPELENLSTDDEEESDPEPAPYRRTTVHPNTRIIIPGPVHGSYDIEVNINTTARAVARAGRELELENPLRISCVMPLLHFVVNAAPPEPEVDSGNDSPDEEAAKFFE